MYTLLSAAQIQAVEEVGTKAGLSLIEYGIVGIVLLISLLVNVGCVLKLMKVQDKRVSDKEADNDRLERLTTSTIEVLAKVTNTIENLERSDRDQAAILAALKTSMDTVILSAVRGGG